jgi:hypothetical protein
VTQSLVDALSALPATPSITYRGASRADMNAAMTLQGVLPTSVDPRVASENFTANQLVAMVTITGRNVGPLSRHPGDQEIALLPGTVLLPAGSMLVDGLASPVVLMAEPGSAPGLPENAAALRETVRSQIGSALGRPPVVVHAPGRFAA